MTKLNAELLLQNQSSPNTQPAWTTCTMSTMPDFAFRLSAGRLHWFYGLTKPWIKNIKDEMEMVCMFIKYCLLHCYGYRK